MAGNLKAFLAEFVGTFALVFVSAGAVCADAVTGGRLGLTGIALAYGLALAAMSLTFGRACGGQFNPAITAALLLNRRMNLIRGVLFVAAQLLGAALAGILLRAALHTHEELLTAAPFLGACDMGSGVGFKAGTLLEAVATFFLACASMAPGDSRGGGGQAAGGCVLAAAVLVLGPLTGAALNPARAFGPAVATGHWSNWFVYWIGPVTGAVPAVFLYGNLYAEKTK